MKVTLKTITPNAEINIVEIARVSSNRIDKSEKPEGLINYLIKNKHWSPFEHSSITFEIVTSKAIGIQLLRHRSFTFQEFSQRYAVVENIEQIDFRLQAEKNRQSSTISIGQIYQLENNSISVGVPNGEDELEQMTNELHINIDKLEEHVDWINRAADSLHNILELYKEGINLGMAKECVRMILPMATQTTIYMTGNIRSWIHFLDIRDDSHAQKEIQLIAKEIKRLFIEQCPIISKAKEYING